MSQSGDCLSLKSKITLNKWFLNFWSLTRIWTNTDQIFLEIFQCEQTIQLVPGPDSIDKQNAFANIYQILLAAKQKMDTIIINKKTYADIACSVCLQNYLADTVRVPVISDCAHMMCQSCFTILGLCKFTFYFVNHLHLAYIFWQSFFPAQS